MNCPECLMAGARIVALRETRVRINGVEHRHYQCPECGYVWQEPAK